MTFNTSLQQWSPLIEHHGSGQHHSFRQRQEAVGLSHGRVPV
jgi:hypothetical protein